MSPAVQAHLDRHRQRVIRLTDAAREYREEAREALSQYAENISGRQGQVINFLAVISAIFLPLTFITGYFGMNFDVLTEDLKTFRVYILLGNLLPRHPWWSRSSCSGAGSPAWASRGSCRPAGQPGNRQGGLRHQPPAIPPRRHDGAAAIQPSPGASREAGEAPAILLRVPRTEEAILCAQQWAADHRRRAPNRRSAR